MKTKSLIGVLIISLGFSACDKNEENEDWSIDEAVTYATEQTDAEAVDADLEALAEEAETGELTSFKNASSCATLVRDTTTIPPRIIIDFGPANCIGPDSNYRRGQIIISYTGIRGQRGYNRNLVTQNYFFNDREVISNINLTRTGTNANGNPQSTRNGNGAIVSINQQDTLYWTVNRSREFTQGSNTLVRLDDEFELRGTSNVWTSNGRNRSTTITSPLLRKARCRWISSGTIQITNGRGQTATLNYGNGTCDRWATLNVNGRTRQIRLRW